jgi:hypothetical protein
MADREAEKFNKDLMERSGFGLEAKAAAEQRAYMAQRNKDVAAAKAQWGPKVGAAMMAAAKAAGAWNGKSKAGGTFTAQEGRWYDQGNGPYNAGHKLRAEFNSGLSQGWHPDVLAKRAQAAIAKYQEAEAAWRAHAGQVQR